jgi:hypothetical protein
MNNRRTSPYLTTKKERPLAQTEKKPFYGFKFYPAKTLEVLALTPANVERFTKSYPRSVTADLLIRYDLIK